MTGLDNKARVGPREEEEQVSEAMERILDAVDIETFILCGSEAEGRKLALQLARDLGLQDAGIVFLEFSGPGARVRVRAYVHRPGDRYAWLKPA